MALLKFTCPKCGGHNLIKKLSNVTNYYDVAFHDDSEFEDLEYLDDDLDYTEEEYRCDQCDAFFGYTPDDVRQFFHRSISTAKPVELKDLL